MAAFAPSTLCGATHTVMGGLLAGSTGVCVIFVALSVSRISAVGKSTKYHYVREVRDDLARLQANAMGLVCSKRALERRYPIPPPGLWAGGHVLGLSHFARAMATVRTSRDAGR